ncbi:hypothetical protein [Bradyrhizobium sp. dw_411]|uniref:hypothetical protein n=1 Tax=Bradyrhizobium sp. dw_411 TaxID=2720082 RepID=UPI001BCE65FD|nr:hypothetical protein [Bradyrhizobium sp. dw_411]
MRIAHLIFAGSIAALAILTAPALAKNSNTQKTDDTSASTVSSPCHAYQQAPDGSWNPVSCQEVGAPSQAQTQHRPASQGSNEDAR